MRHPGLLAVLAASTPTAVIEPSPEQGAVPVPAGSWTDTDGYETSSQLMTVEDAWQAVSGDPASRTYLPLLTTQPIPPQQPDPATNLKPSTNTTV